MFRIVDIGPGGAVETSEGPARAAPPPPETLRWIDLRAPDAEALALLGQRFPFHPLALEDCAHFDQRPKLEEYDDHLFLVIHGFICTEGDAARIAPLELHAFLGPHYLVTVHDDDIAALDGVWRRVTADAALGRRGTDYLYYLVADAVVDSHFVVLDRVADTLDELEEIVLRRAEREDLGRLFVLKRGLVGMRRVLAPQRDVLALLARRAGERIDPRVALYFRDVYDHVLRIGEGLDAARDLLANTADAYRSMVAQRTNDVMRRLTVLSAIFLPLTFITGFFGQNFEALPFASSTLLTAALSACLLVPGLMLLWFWRRGWL